MWPTLNMNHHMYIKDYASKIVSKCFITFLQLEFYTDIHVSTHVGILTTQEKCEEIYLDDLEHALCVVLSRLFHVPWETNSQKVSYSFS